MSAVANSAVAGHIGHVEGQEQADQASDFVAKGSDQFAADMTHFTEQALQAAEVVAAVETGFSLARLARSAWGGLKAALGIGKTAGAALGSVTELLRPGGRLIGEAGTSSRIRVLQGGQAEAEAMFRQLSKGGEIVKGTSYPGTLARLPGGGQVGFRPTSTSGPPTIDVAIEGLGIREIKFLP